MKLFLILLCAAMPATTHAALITTPAPTVLLGASSQGGIVRIDPNTGQSTPVAPHGLDNLINFSFTVDSENHVAYLFGHSQGNYALSSVDLRTGANTVVPIGFVSGFAVSRGMILGSEGTTISQIDPNTGAKTFFASSGLDTIINTQFVADGTNHVAYQFGHSGGAYAVSTIDLLTGNSSVATVSTVLALELFNGGLIGSDSRTIFDIDPVSGASSPLASTGLDVIVNSQLAVDDVNDVAYQLGQRNGQRMISVVDLNNGSSTLIPAPLVALEVYTVPEPGFPLLATLLIGSLCLHRRPRGS